MTAPRCVRPMSASPSAATERSPEAAPDANQEEAASAIGGAADVAASVRVKALLHYLAQSSKNTWNVTVNAIYRLALRTRTSRQRRTRRRIAIACRGKD
jgi:hypothetical protein